MQEEAVINYFNNIYDHGAFNKHYNDCTFNPLDKVVELYERLVQAEKDKNEYLEKFTSSAIDTSAQTPMA
ncbi:hypothetical protein [Flavobacterium sp. Leaf82]|uniref:hypothetical protein n=1 Tax=Flavobacterium sp. Leaf82 TaxID=1736238 RepID=UPI000AA70223